MNTTCDPVTSEGKRPTNRAVVAAMFRSRAYGFKGNAPTSVTATMKRTAVTAITGGLLVASTAGMAVAVSFAPVAAAKGQEGGVVCTGTQMASHTCQPTAVEATPIGSIPLGCKVSSVDTVACGRRGYHVSAAGPADPSAGSAASGPTGVAGHARR